jgi:hypothetical protein
MSRCPFRRSDLRSPVPLIVPTTFAGGITPSHPMVIRYPVEARSVTALRAIDSTEPSVTPLPSTTVVPDPATSA